MRCQNTALRAHNALQLVLLSRRILYPRSIMLYNYHVGSCFTTSIVDCYIVRLDAHCMLMGLYSMPIPVHPQYRLYYSCLNTNTIAALYIVHHTPYTILYTIHHTPYTTPYTIHNTPQYTTYHYNTGL